jgi:hypothetical protein
MELTYPKAKPSPNSTAKGAGVKMATLIEQLSHYTKFHLTVIGERVGYLEISAG